MPGVVAVGAVRARAGVLEMVSDSIALSYEAIASILGRAVLSLLVAIAVVIPVLVLLALLSCVVAQMRMVVAIQLHSI